MNQVIPSRVADRIRANRTLRQSKPYYVIDDAACWVWQLHLTTDGYGKLTWRSDGGKANYLAHRAVYEIHSGTIPEGHDIDHLCRNRACVNPAHLEPVTHRVNLLRGDTFQARKAAQTHCIHGHLFDVENTAITKRGNRQCRACVADASRRYRERLKSH